MTLIKDLHAILRPGDLIFTADLEKAYYSVPMHESAWPYMGFDTPKGLLVATILVFGAGTAPYIFHKITRPMVALAGALGVRLMSYLDDFLFMASPEETPDTQEFARWLFPLLGWQTNDKCDWKPSRAKKFLGLIVDPQSERNSWENQQLPARKVRTNRGAGEPGGSNRCTQVGHSGSRSMDQRLSETSDQRQKSENQRNFSDDPV